MFLVLTFIAAAHRKQTRMGSLWVFNVHLSYKIFFQNWISCIPKILLCFYFHFISRIFSFFPNPVDTENTLLIPGVVSVVSLDLISSFISLKCDRIEKIVLIMDIW